MIKGCELTDKSSLLCGKVQATSSPYALVDVIQYYCVSGEDTRENGYPALVSQEIFCQ